MTDVMLAYVGAPHAAAPAQREHLGLAYLTSSVTAAGHRCGFIDAAHEGLDVDTLVERIALERPTLVGFSLYLNNVTVTLRAIRALRRSDCRAHITLGGHHATFHWREILANHPELDSILRGESELALADLAGRLRQRRPWQDTPNLASRDSAGVPYANPCRPLITDLDRLPPPNRDPYRSAVEHSGVTTMVSSRGCYAHCGFCSVRAFTQLAAGPLWRPRSPAGVVAEMEDLQGRFGARQIIFVDDNFMGPGLTGRRRAGAIADLVRGSGLRIQWTLACRANDLEATTLVRLREAGLVRVDLGVESWTPRQLELYDKALTPEQNDRAIDLLERLGLDYRLYLIPIDPYVQVPELEHNVRRMQRRGGRHVTHPLFNRLAAFAGTPLAERIARDGLLSRRAGVCACEHGRPYRFADPRMTAVDRALRRLDQSLARTVNAAKALLPLAAAPPPVLGFAMDWMAAINEAALETARQVLCAYRRGRPGAARERLRRGNRALAAGVRRVRRAWQEQSFATFKPFRVRVGRRTVRFPPPAFATLQRTLANAALRIRSPKAS
ncbi:MAG TPA: radical SAM protein [Candidatus Paceibacterota bacterium]|nr:radical SAM protein [Candidatus Paceibacterota bacterium]HRZ55268.1 radical SAM protein [Candidatus Paceibacterota bacterium]